MKHEERLQQALLEFAEIATEAFEAHRAKVLEEVWEDIDEMLEPVMTDADDILNAILDGKIRHLSINF